MFRNKKTGEIFRKISYTVECLVIEGHLRICLIIKNLTYCKRLHDDVLHISKKPLRGELSGFLSICQAEASCISPRCIRRQCCRFVNNVRYVFEEVHSVESARAYERIEHDSPFGSFVRTEEQRVPP